MVFLFLALSACGPSEAELSRKAELDEQHRVDEERAKKSEGIRLGTKPVLPPIPAVVIDKDGKRDVMLRFHYVIDSNPDESVRVTMRGLLENGELLLEIDPEMEPVAVAQFRAVPGDLNGRDPTKVYPTFVMSPQWLDGMKNDTDVLAMMNGIAHEFNHYMQWQDGDTVTRVHFGPIYGVEPKSECPLIWTTEREAYWNGCVRSNSWGNPTYGVKELCTETTATGFDRALVVHLARTRPAATTELCLTDWASFVGKSQ